MLHGVRVIPQFNRPFFFFFNDTATTEIYTLSLHDALPILVMDVMRRSFALAPPELEAFLARVAARKAQVRSEEHTSELQSLAYLVCRLLLEKKKKNKTSPFTQEDIQNIECLRIVDWLRVTA